MIKRTTSRGVVVGVNITGVVQGCRILHVFQKNMIRLNSVFHKIRPKFDLHSGFVWSAFEHVVTP